MSRLWTPGNRKNYHTKEKKALGTCLYRLYFRNLFFSQSDVDWIAKAPPTDRHIIQRKIVQLQSRIWHTAKTLDLARNNRNPL